MYVLCPDEEKIYEDNYDGYGHFGGYDIYTLLATWNKPEKCTNENGELLSNDELRIVGINIEFSDEPIKYPIKIVEDSNMDYNDVEASKRCAFQGYFY